ncbi:hypothetical protein DIZ27_26945 [Streptomyces sp. NWU339]|uniref:DUF998 domain-containing protein n=1 Tax=Streptomyces sp. NWU339 TaxID=2185284 RepID=UPI000D67375C|nr:DUF998 domain-containing protein [Streptomyces sp. NWU339]PWI07644.1 hypothetical protein DIZ27_26945 [Streptomyces sp. NWU339]
MRTEIFPEVKDREADGGGAAHPTAPPRMSFRWLPAGIGGAVAAIGAADLLNPQYSWVSEVISRYVNGTAGWLITVALLLIAGVSAVLAVRLRRAGAPRAGRWALRVWTAGVLVAGVFPADPPGQWGRPSTADIVHGTAAVWAFLALPVAALVLHRWLVGRWARGAAVPRVVLGTLLVSTAVLLVCLVDVMDGPSLGVGGVPTVVGLVERVAFGADLVWLALATVAASRPAVRPAARS